MNPSWPSLYNPRTELFFIQHHNPIQPGGFYLVHSQDVFRFTLYWTLVFYMPIFFLTSPSTHPRSPTSATHPFLLSPTSPTTGHIYPPLQTKQVRKKRPKNARRSRATFALLVLFTFLLLSLIGAVVSSAIVGYILTGLYKAGGFFMSTWVPFLWAAISVMVGMLNVWPSVINLI
ncbi:hypothetical protein BT96DRAFT_967434 [Gymnopus androsaceus JB14]|uniref:Uncharacterized protein n=1 Tax=Gymnopus androsaceus JB14 TaxID=1447944 RepID=A0A6A4H598_9AGAR|nr:hypothetical protein BT96DRAFT_967434 [Gymnopus androsaceus JB14]